MDHDDRTIASQVPGPGDRVGQYTILSKLGAGGMGEVYLAEDSTLKRKVALKFLPAHYAADTAFRTRFAREAQAAAALNHPNIVHIYEVGEHRGSPYIAMEHVEGAPLKDLIQSKEFTPSDVLSLGIQLAEGLAEAHGAGIVHRDIKPGNIVMDKHQRPKLLDFGLAGMTYEPTITRSGSTLGTVAYMSPEQARGEQADHRADLFSLGCVLYQMLTGKLPFNRETEAATMEAILREAPEPVHRYKSGVGDGLQKIIDRLLDKDVKTRYQTALDVAADLRREKKVLDGETGPTMIRPAPPKPASRLRWIGAVGMALVLAAVVLVLKPWDSGSPVTQARAGENRLVVLYFDNVADPEDSKRLGEIIPTLVITDLSDSRDVQVVSSQRLYDLVKQVGEEGQRTIDPGLASKVARKAGAKWMLTGSILQAKPRLVLTTQLVDVQTGDVVASERTQGERGEEVFTVVDRMTAQLRRDLALPAVPMDDDRSVADATTHSAEAYQLYLEGLEYTRLFYMGQAMEAFAAAVEIDPEFAMAYNQLAMIQVRQGELPAAMTNSAKALEYRDRADWRGQQQISMVHSFVRADTAQAVSHLEAMIEQDPEDKEALYLLAMILRYGDDVRSNQYFEQTLVLDPEFGDAYNQLAYSYDRVGDTEKSLAAINKYIELSPGEANPYDSRGDLYLYHGKLELGLESYRKAVELGDMPYSRLKEAAVLATLGRPAEADSIYPLLYDDSGVGTYARWLWAYLPVRFGDFETAFARIETMHSQLGEEPMEIFFKVGSDLALTQLHLYLEDIPAATAINSQVLPRFDAMLVAGIGAAPLNQKLQILITQGRQDEAAAFLAATTDTLRANGQERAALEMEGFYAYLTGDHDTSVRLAEGLNSLGDFTDLVVRGMAYLEAGLLGDAVESLEDAVNRYDDTRWERNDLDVLIYYYLGAAYDQSGWGRKAVEQYQAFLKRWDDDRIKQVRHARERLVALGV